MNGFHPSVSPAADQPLHPDKSVSHRRKVAVVTRKLDVGGTERHLLQVLPHLDRDRFDVDVISLRPGGRLEVRMRAAGIPVQTPPPGIDGWKALLWSAATITLRMLRERRTIFHFFLPEAYAVGGLCGLLTWHRRLIMSRRSLNHYQAGHPWVARLERIMHRRMSAVAANSLAVLADLRAEGAPEDRLHLLYNGLDPAPFLQKRDRHGVRARLGLAENEVVMVMVANLIPYKGHLDLVAALAAVKDRMPPWKLLLVGRDDGVAPQIAQAAKNNGTADRIRLLGERDDVDEVLCAADIGILCSHQEGFSNSVLEGMAAGLPMVVTDVGGNGEAIGTENCGLIVPPATVTALADAILRLATDSGLRERMGAAARMRMQQEFSLHVCVQGYEKMYDLVAKRWGGV